MREMGTERLLEFDQVQFVCHNRFIKPGAWAPMGSKERHHFRKEDRPLSETKLAL